jgi:hypothetical protein
MGPKIWFRAVGYIGNREVKFLSRYRIVKDNGECHPRITRVVKDITIRNSLGILEGMV